MIMRSFGVFGGSDGKTIDSVKHYVVPATDTHTHAHLSLSLSHIRRRVMNVLERQGAVALKWVVRGASTK